LNGIFIQKNHISDGTAWHIHVACYARQSCSSLAVFVTKTDKLVRKIGHTGAPSGVFVAFEGRVVSRAMPRGCE